MRHLLSLFCVLALAPAAQAEPLRWHLQAESTVQLDRWRGARLDTLSRTDTRQRLRLSGWKKLPDLGRHARFSVLTDLEVGADFGPSTADQAARLDSRRVALDLYAATLALDELWGLVDLRLGRQLRFDTLGADALDGLRLRLRPAPYLSVEGEAGWAARRGWSDFGPDVFEPDGATLSDEPAYILGAALATRDLPHLRARAAWRRHTTGAGADARLQREVVGVALEVRPWTPLTVDGGARHDLIFEQLGEAWTTAALHLGPARLDAGWRFSRPLFNADSIWNAFSAEPSHRLHTGAHLSLGAWRLEADGAVQRFNAGPSDARGAHTAATPTDDDDAYDAGARITRHLVISARPAHLGAEARAGFGYGGTRHYGDVFARLPWRPLSGRAPFDVRARLGAVYMVPDRVGGYAQPLTAGWGLVSTDWAASEALKIGLLSELHLDEHTPYRLRVMARISLEDWY